MGKITKGNIISVNFYKGEPAHYFFGSLAAIFEVFTPEQVGCTLDWLWVKGRFDNERHAICTSTCVIARHTIYRKANVKSRKTRRQ